jgi:hypothetical protein
MFLWESLLQGQAVDEGFGAGDWYRATTSSANTFTNVLVYPRQGVRLCLEFYRFAMTSWRF